jgi:hypothetical protein
MLVLGWNEFLAVLYNPLWLLAALVLFLFGKTVYEVGGFADAEAPAWDDFWMTSLKPGWDCPGPWQAVASQHALLSRWQGSAPVHPG